MKPRPRADWHFHLGEKGRRAETPTTSAVPVSNKGRLARPPVNICHIPGRQRWWHAGATGDRSALCPPYLSSHPTDPQIITPDHRATKATPSAQLPFGRRSVSGYLSRSLSVDILTPDCPCPRGSGGHRRAVGNLDHRRALHWQAGCHSVYTCPGSPGGRTVGGLARRLAEPRRN